nr:anthranilate synthase component I [Lachnospiraceae bacterium]
MQLQQYKSYHFYPMKRELLSDSCTPIQVLRILQNKGKHCFLLESVEKSEHLGRYT